MALGGVGRGSGVFSFVHSGRFCIITLISGKEDNLPSD